MECWGVSQGLYFGCFSFREPWKSLSRKIYPENSTKKS